MAPSLLIAVRCGTNASHVCLSVAQAVIQKEESAGRHVRACTFFYL